MRSLILGVALLLLSVQTPAQQRLDCVRVDGPNGTFSLSCAPETPPTPPPAPVNCAGTWSPWAPVPGPPGEWSACQQDTGGQWRQSRQESRSFAVTTPAANGGTACPASPEAREFVQSCTPPAPQPPPTSSAIWPARVVDPTVLGTCSADEHDRSLADGGDGFRYYTWHGPTGSNGCRYAHEHGGDPAPVVTALVSAINAHEAAGRYTATQAAVMRDAARAPMLMGRIARAMPMPTEPNGHVEPHEGFKVFYAYQGEQNDENRRSLITALFLTHMGTGGTGRFTMPHHSSIGKQVHRDGPAQFTELMVNFGTANTVCNPRVAPTRDVIAILTSPCGIDSPYEIWTGHATILGLARQIVTPAVFDPITVMNRSNPSELVYAWDPRVLVTRNHDGDSWAGFRGCNRESYAQMPTYFAAGFRDVGTNAMGNAPGPFRQVLYSPTATSDIRGSDDGNHAFKIRRNHCVPGLGLKN